MGPSQLLCFLLIIFGRYPSLGRVSSAREEVDELNDWRYLQGYSGDWQ